MRGIYAPLPRSGISPGVYAGFVHPVIPDRYDRPAAFSGETAG
jgi:hypothetical protein